MSHVPPYRRWMLGSSPNALNTHGIAIPHEGVGLGAGLKSPCVRLSASPRVGKGVGSSSWAHMSSALTRASRSVRGFQICQAVEAGPGNQFCPGSGEQVSPASPSISKTSHMKLFERMAQWLTVRYCLNDLCRHRTPFFPLAFGQNGSRCVLSSCWR